MAGIRTFIAFELPQEVRAQMTAYQSQLRRAGGGDIRWEPPEHFHCTIKFLGDVAPELLPDVLSRTAGAISGSPAFAVEVGAVGFFPDHRHPKVLWLGCRNTDGRLELLHRQLDDVLSPIGFAPEERAFRPHLTLGRVKGTRGIADLLSTMEKCTFEPHAVHVTEVVVMKSVLKPQGAEYTVVQTTQLLP